MTDHPILALYENDSSFILGFPYGTQKMLGLIPEPRSRISPEKHLVYPPPKSTRKQNKMLVQKQTAKFKISMDNSSYQNYHLRKEWKP